MKKMQCEVCGSTDIKKIDDSTFECQSCGVQYSKNEVQKLLVEITGKVEIDHSEEIDNLLTRAQQFIEQNDIPKALEYFNKVLDLNPEEKTALHMVDAIKKEQHREKESNSSAIQIIKHTIEPNKTVENFLHALRNAPDITPDIYKEIEIISVTQGYFPFEVIDKQFSCTYEGIACYRKQVPYTDYETKTDYNNKNQDGSYKKIQVAVTKYREEIERQPVNGSFLSENFGVFSVGKDLNDLITSISPEQYDSIINSDTYFDETMKANMQRTKYNDVIIQKAEKYIADSYSSIKNSVESISTSEQKEINGIEIVSCANKAWQNRANNAFAKQVEEIVDKKAKEVIPGEFNENTHYRWSEKYSKIETIYVPVQIIEYAYRGKFYISVILLNQDKNLLMSYPCNTDIQSAKKKADETVTNIKKRKMPAGIVILYMFMVAGIITPIWMAITEGGISGEDFLLYFLFSGWLGIPAILWHILWSRKKKKEIKQELLQSTETVDNIENTYGLELAKEYDAFFNIFKGVETITDATMAAKKESSFNADISSIKGQMSFVSLTKNSNSGYEESSNGKGDGILLDNNGLEISEGHTYSIYLISCGNNKVDVLKILREEYGLGLATAKEKIETPHSLLESKMNSSKTKSIAFNLKSAGAAIEIKRED